MNEHAIISGRRGRARRRNPSAGSVVGVVVAIGLGYAFWRFVLSKAHAEAEQAAAGDAPTDTKAGGPAKDMPDWAQAAEAGA